MLCCFPVLSGFTFGFGRPFASASAYVAFVVVVVVIVAQWWFKAACRHCNSAVKAGFSACACLTKVIAPCRRLATVIVAWFSSPIGCLCFGFSSSLRNSDSESRSVLRFSSFGSKASVPTVFLGLSGPGSGLSGSALASGAVRPFSFRGVCWLQLSPGRGGCCG